MVLILVYEVCGRGLREHSLISKYACAHIRSAWAVRLMYGAWTRECWAETWCWVNANIPWRPQSFRTTSHVNCYLLYWLIFFSSFLDLSLTNIFFLFFHILSFLLNIFSNIILSPVVSHTLFSSHISHGLVLSYFASHTLISHNLVSFCLTHPVSSLIYSSHIISSIACSPLFLKSFSELHVYNTIHTIITHNSDLFGHNYVLQAQFCEIKSCNYLNFFLWLKRACIRSHSPNEIWMSLSCDIRCVHTMSELP